MPVQIAKPENHAASLARAKEAEEAITEFFRALAPAVQKAGEDMGRAFEQIRTQRPA
jgi:hypothetical protein